MSPIYQTGRNYLPNHDFSHAREVGLLTKRITNILLISMFLVGTAAHSAPLCQSGDSSIQLTIMPPSGKPLPLKVGTAYFDQRSIPQDGSSRGGLLLTMQATDFSPWPRGLRPHSSEGPKLSYLLTSVRPFDELADSMAGLNAGYSYTAEVTSTDAPGPFGLSVPTAPAPANPEGGPFTGRDDIYISRDQAGAITDIISCMRPGRTPFQHCQHFIEAGEMDIQISYAPEFLSDWKRLSTGARDFLNCMMEG